MPGITEGENRPKSITIIDKNGVRHTYPIGSASADAAMVPKDHAPSDTSDGFHTFDELYAHRRALTALLATIGSSVGNAWRSKDHHPTDDPVFDGYFIVGLELPDDTTVTYHYELEYWHQFDGVTELEHAPKWDGHTPADAVERLIRFQRFLAAATREARED